MGGGGGGGGGENVREVRRMFDGMLEVISRGMPKEGKGVGSVEVLWQDYAELGFGRIMLN